MNRGLVIGAVALVLIGGVAVWGFSGNDAGAPVVPQENPAAGTVPEGSGADVGPADEPLGGMSGPVGNPTIVVGVSGSNFAFDPKEIRVNRGDTVRITFQNTGGMHDWRLEGYEVGTKVLGAGQSETVEFTADQAGQFEYYCSVGRHREMGMKGTLIVQ